VTVTSRRAGGDGQHDAGQLDLDRQRAGGGRRDRPERQRRLRARVGVANLLLLIRLNHRRASGDDRPHVVTRAARIIVNHADAERVRRADLQSLAVRGRRGLKSNG
jgi:hypothetical protein